MERVIDVPLVSLPYEDRIETLLRHKVGLWEVIKSAERQGSLDSKIRAPETTDLPSLVLRLPQLDAVAFNGRKSELIGKPQLDQLPLKTIALPSSSPAHATLNFAEKAEEWDKLQHFLR